MQRQAQGAGIAAGGLVLAGIQVLHATNRTATTVGFLIDAVPFVLMALAIAFTGYWIARATDEEHTGVAVVPPDAEFDDDAPVAPVDDDEDDDEIEGLRAGEFVCRGCFMAKRETQLADPDRLLCRDCA